MRARILALIRSRPGARLARIIELLAANRGTTKYHLAILEGKSEVSKVRAHGQTRYFPTTTPVEDRPLLALLLWGRVREISERVLARPGVGQTELVEELRIGRKMFRKYIAELVSHELIREEKGPHVRRYYARPRLGPLIKVLSSIDQEGCP